jgi:hypothetical protein
MFRFLGLCFGTLVRLLRARRGLLLENLVLRQQLAVLKRLLSEYIRYTTRIARIWDSGRERQTEEIAA